MTGSGRRCTLLTISLAGIALALASFSAKPTLVWNFSESAPLGLYVALNRPWKKGDWVAVRPAPHTSEILRRYKVIEPGRLLVKRVAAASGDEVCRRGAMVTINNAYAAWALEGDKDKVLPVWRGCRRLQSGDVLLLGSADRSFDGRYFGVTQGADIVIPIEPAF